MRETLGDQGRVVRGNMKSVGCLKWLLRAGMRFRQANGAVGKAALGQVADFDFGRYRNALDQALKGLRRDEGRNRQQRQIRRVETGPRRQDGDSYPSIQSLLGRQGALGTPAVLSRNLTRYYRLRQSDDLTWKRLTLKSAT